MKKLIRIAIQLVLTVIFTVTSLYAWFSLNNKTSATGIIGNTDDVNYSSVSLERYVANYDTTTKKQGWFTKNGNKITLSGKAQILEIVGDKVLIKNHNDNTIYFVNSQTEQLSETYKEVFICGYDRFIVKNSKNKYMVINSNFEKVFESEWDFVDTS